MESLHGRFALSFVPAGKSMGPKNMYTERRFEEQFFLIETGGARLLLIYFIKKK
jgi:hypothetical protein